MTNSHLNYPTASPEPVMCEVCGAYFETRRGLSNHARLHLRQLGVTLSDTSGAPIELLYQVIRERDGSLLDLKTDSPVALTPTKITSQQEPRATSVPEDKSPLRKAGIRVISTPQTMDQQKSPARSKQSAAALLPSSPSAPSSSSLEHKTTPKPLWAPLETDAPITLGMASEWLLKVLLTTFSTWWHIPPSCVPLHSRHNRAA